MKWGRHLIAKVYTRPFPPAFLCRPGATFILQSPLLVDGPSSRVSDHGLSPGGWRRGKLIVGGVVQDFLWFADLSQPAWLRSDLPRSDLPRSGALRPHGPDLVCRDLTCSDLIKIPSDRLYGTPQGFREAGASRLVRRRFREPSKKFWFRPDIALLLAK